MRIEKRIAGELQASEIPVEKRTENERRDYYWHGWYTYGNPVQELVWTPEIKPGETKTFSFTFRVYKW